MTAKEYLMQVRNADNLIKVKEEELCRLQLNIGQLSPQAQSERVQSSSKCDFMRTVDKIVDLQAEINREIDRLVDLKEEARNRINKLTDSRYVTVLTEYYINHKTWEQVAEYVESKNKTKKGMTTRHIHRLHGEALQQFRKNFLNFS